MTDFVNDYRELSRLSMWDELLENAGSDFRVLDVCSGTGRFTQAFYELVLRPRMLKVTHDYTDLCGHSLDILRNRMVALGETPNRVFAGDCSKLASMIEEPYDLIVNMHGLYGLPSESLSAALQSMYDALSPGGTMVLAIGTTDSLYQRVPLFLYRAGLLKTPYTNNKDIRKHLADLGIEYTIENIVYHEEYKVDDTENLQRFIMDECGGNTFSVEDALAQKIDLDSSWGAMGPLVKLYLDPRAQTYRFKQEIAIFKIQKTVETLPDILSADSFYADAYALRRNASTMQSNMISWLKTKSAENLLSHLPQGNSSMKMFSIGCGDGELDLAIMEGCRSKIGNVDFVGIEPNCDLSVDFAKKTKEAQGAGLLPSSVKTSVVDKTFDANFALEDGAWQPDLVVMGHVLYYFGGPLEKAAALRRALRFAAPGGRVVVIHQAAQGVPELQKSLLPLIRGSTKDMFTADDIENMLNRELKDDVAGFVRHDVDAFLDLAEVIKGSPKGIKIMSFCLEADHRTASDAVLMRSIAAFKQHSHESAEPGRAGGPFMAEPVVCFVIEPSK